MGSTTLLVSIQPQYAKKIFAGTKQVELRRVRPNVTKGDTLAIYVSSPEKELRGAAKILGLIEGTPEQIWNLVGDVSGLARPDFMGYFKGCQRAFAIRLGLPMELAQPTPLDTIRKKHPTFHPPQMYRYLDSNTAQSLGLANAA